MVPSGYGQQVRLLAPRLRAMGHDVAISAFSGLSGSSIDWDGMRVYPAGDYEFGIDVLIHHAADHQADVVITLMDFWKLSPIAPQLRSMRVLAWLASDCEPMSRMDQDVLNRSGAIPVAMSRFGQRNIQAAFADIPAPRYAPHAVDTAVFRPPEDRAALRAELHPDDAFLIGICAANRDATRKGFPEQFEAFARFHAEHPDSRLMVHTKVRSPTGFHLDQMAARMGIGDAVVFSDQYAQTAGVMTSEIMADWFGCLDVLSNCSYAEGFGVPIIEAQACGTPVIVTEGSAMTELAEYGWTVKGQPFWNPMHEAWWTRPDVSRIAEAYEKAYKERGKYRARDRREQAATFALAYYSADYVVKEYWRPLLEAIAYTPAAPVS